MYKHIRFGYLFIVIVFVISACNLPSNATPTQGVDAALTAAAQTVEANMTQAAILNPPTVPATSTAGIATSTLAFATTSVPPTNTQPPTQACDIAQFVDDVTIPDGTTLKPDETFTKTWRLKNVGTCSWTTSYAVVFSNGDSLSGPATQALSGNVNPGQTVDISVNLKAPGTEGSYKGYWKIRNASGVFFAQFYVDIKVKAATPTPTATATSTPTATKVVGDLQIIEIFMSTQFEVVARVGTTPVGSLNGNYQYTVYSNGAQVAQGSCTIPTGSEACYTGYKVAGSESIQVVIDSSNTVTESNESNNSKTVNCDKFTLSCT